MKAQQTIQTVEDLDRDEAIDGRVAVHDSNHVELKLDYRLGSAGPRSRYRVEAYFFVPRSLGLTEHTYGREQFYNDLQTYIRFKTPSIPLEILADPERDGSPLAQIVTMSAALLAEPRRRSLSDKLRYELRMFGCVARARLRDRIRSLEVRIQELDAPPQRRAILVEDLSVLSGRFLERVSAMVTAWRELRTTLLDRRMPARVRDTFELVDEYLSLAIEIGLTSLIRRIDRSPRLNGEVAMARRRARDLLLREREYRSGAGYPSADALHEGGEELIYRMGMLKKFVTSVLWLEVNKERDGRTLADIGAGIAAGLAMLFAVMATILHMKWWMINTSGFVVAAVVTYILKDRIKDWLKHYFSRRMSRWLSDHNLGIRDPLTGTELGRSREAFSYVSMDRVPDHVVALRQKQARSPDEIDAKPEVVFKYDKAIKLENRKVIERMHLEDFDLNDITRFALWQFMTRADDPKSTVPIFDPKEDRVRKRSFRKVYHVNIVMVFHAGSGADETVEHRHLRVVFDKQAIRRLEQVATTT